MKAMTYLLVVVNFTTARVTGQAINVNSNIHTSGAMDAKTKTKEEETTATVSITVFIAVCGASEY